MSEALIKFSLFSLSAKSRPIKVRQWGEGATKLAEVRTLQVAVPRVEFGNNLVPPHQMSALKFASSDSAGAPPPASRCSVPCGPGERGSGHWLKVAFPCASHGKPFLPSVWCPDLRWQLAPRNPPLQTAAITWQRCNASIYCSQRGLDAVFSLQFYRQTPTLSATPTTTSEPKPNGTRGTASRESGSVQSRNAASN